MAITGSIVRSGVLTALLAAACNAPAPQRVAADRELKSLDSLETQYRGVVMGFDIRTPQTLTVSLDLQSYIDLDDDVVVAMQRAVLARWRAAWIGEHPRESGTLRVHFIDFIGRTVADETTVVRRSPQ